MATETGNTTQQTGARSEEAPRKTWSSLPKTLATDSTRRLIGNSTSCKVNALDIIKADREQLIMCYQRLCGAIGRINVFLSEENENSDSDPGYAVLSASCNRVECEEALQQIMRDKHNVFTASLNLLRIMNDQMISKAKRVLSDSLESSEKSVWYCWMQYIGSELDSMTEGQQQLAERNMSKWWTLMTKIYDKLAAIILDVDSDVGSVIDVETGLKEWRNLLSMTKGAADFEEVFYRERLIFNNYELGKVSGITWEKRRELLMKLISRKELGLDSILDLKRVELTIAEGYDEWIESARMLFKLAEAKGMKFACEQDVKEKPKKAKQEAVETHVPTPKNFASPNFEPADKPKIVPKDVCFKCGQTGHWANRCPTFTPTYRREYGDKGSDEPKPREQLVPGTGTPRFPNVRPAGPTYAPKSAAPAPVVRTAVPPTNAVEKTSYYRTSSGRNVYKPKTMVTFSETVEEVPRDSDEEADEPQRPSTTT